MHRLKHHHMAYLQAAAALAQICGLWINTKQPIREQQAGAEFIYWTKLLSITTDKPCEAAVSSTGRLQHRERCEESFANATESGK